MFAIAGQTAGPNGLNFFEGTLEYPGVTQNLKIRHSFLQNSIFFPKNRFFIKFVFLKLHGQRRTLQLVFHKKF